MAVVRAEIIGASPELDEVGGGRGNLPGDPTAREATAFSCIP
ncbi:hypothetical protein [Polycladomyces zharkentensis]|nr:hypothetical protein [Polycladomyces sp. WAk]